MNLRPNPARRSGKSQQAILAAALALCTERGYARVTVEGIAARAGVSKKTIYRWWPSKGALVLEAIDAAVIGSRPFPDTGDLAADLHAQMSAVVGLLAHPPLGPAYAGVLTEIQYDDDLARTVQDVFIGPRLELATARLRSAQEQGVLPRDTDLGLAVEMLYGPLYYRHTLRRPTYDADELTRLIAHVLKGLGG
ncbi:TetR/AcrR family transcriptional regulator [Streptomyces sp. NBC_01267]|uniref:TetR/AcrR family transcriptional regulator n=1 Tax=unclassified Streptomyces TaxID=2593676 RepID=UPI002251ED38|nr:MULTISPECIES: TetR/AcrR family transcriptional regulator [unclassified Streptomyces]MCX4548948.1 TetR/AcrR family transcriptional regulator [Streptomyces sp. NBC_01500]WSC20525.1 TetR/AcrR family transcriptional regulator [Streptomyces sp. NBC_01766]